MCDRCKQQAVQNVIFDFDGGSFSIDVCEAHRLRLIELDVELAAFASAAIRLSRRRTQLRRDLQRGHNREDYTKVRQWAEGNGLEVAKRGRIADSVLRAYRDAMSSGDG
jgi:hypothetical protein